MQKCILIIDDSQKAGVLANIASVLSISLGNLSTDMVGHDVYDKQGGRHPGITQLPIPILGASRDKIKEIRQMLLSKEIPGMVVVDFTTIAQQSKTYDEYEKSIGNADDNDINYIGIGVYGEKKAINKATGNLRSIK